MSGPKISVYELSGWARANVNGQMRCEQQSISCANQIELGVSYILGCRGTIEELLTRLKLLNERCEVDGNCVASLQEMLGVIEKESTELLMDLQSHRPHLSEKYQISEEALAEKKQQLAAIRKIKQNVEALQKEIEKPIQQATVVVEKLENTAQDSIAEDLAAYVYLDFSAPVEVDALETERTELEAKLKAMFLDKECPNSLKEEIGEAMNSLGRIVSIDYLHTFSSLTIRALEAKSSLIKEQKKEEEKLRKDLLDRYEVLCQLTGVQSNVDLFRSAEIETIEKEVERIELLAVKQREQEYISDCVEEVLSEMGYELLGSREVKKKSGKKFRNELYSFDEGTAVNVTFSSDGQIAMELGGIAHEDRLPNEEEVGELTEDMETFCGEFAEIERRLKEKGVIVGTRIEMSPPAAEYAAIINVNDYQIHSSKQITEMATRRRKKRSATKTMRRENE